MSTVEFTIKRNPEKEGSDALEYWVYEEVLGARQQGNYIIVSMQDRSAFIPVPWIVDVKEL